MQLNAILVLSELYSDICTQRFWAFNMPTFLCF